MIQFAVATALSLLIAAPAFAGTVKPVTAKTVQVTASGREIVKADGAVYIQLQPSEYSELTAQEYYEKFRTKMRAGFEEAQAEADRKNYMIDRSNLAGIYRNTNTLPPRTVTAGFSISDLKPIKADQYEPTRQNRIESNARTYLIVRDERNSGAFANVGCENLRGRQDTVGLSLGRSGCFAKLKVFKKF